MTVLAFLLVSCGDDTTGGTKDPADPITGDTLNPGIADDYSAIAEQHHMTKWGPYNLHDPTIIRHEEWYHIFSTDVAYGPNGRCGIMHRRSRDLVQWQFLGWVFDGVPDIPLQFMLAHQGGYKQESIWAPFIYRHSDVYRLYYSVPGNDWVKLACIGLATAESPDGPWEDQGIVVSCLPEDHYNAIDPAVVVDRQNGRHWFAYGSYSSGLYLLELDPETGKALDENDRGHRIAYRSRDHDAIEGAEFVYNEEFGMYYLFVSYDWLEDDYNVRVGRSKLPEGPYLDIMGNDLAGTGDNQPMITAQYGFEGHSGWQGLGHCGILTEGKRYFFVSQGRLGANRYLMNLHVRRMEWTSDGWPVISPERYADVPDRVPEAGELAGEWEHIHLLNTSTKNASSRISLSHEGVISGAISGSWTQEGMTLILKLEGQEEYECRVFQEWDWEHETLTFVYTGMNAKGSCVWGKKTGITTQ